MGGITTRAKATGNINHFMKPAPGWEPTPKKFYDVSWGNTKRLRHKVSPTLYYTYQGYSNNGEESPWFSPIDQDDYGTPWYLTFDEDGEKPKQEPGDIFP